MAYVGTPTKLRNEQDTLRSIVLGEASGEGQAGMTAVAAVMQNRANAGGFGGSTMLDVALAPNQFQGQSDLSRFSPQQIATADAAIAAAKSGVDPTGGALFYANPGPSTARWAKNLSEDNSLVLGNHYFTDNIKGKSFLTQDQKDTLQDSFYDQKDGSATPGDTPSKVDPANPTATGDQSIYQGYDYHGQDKQDQSIYADYDNKRSNPIVGWNDAGPVFNNPDIPAAIDDQTKYETKAINTQTKQQAKSAEDIAKAMMKDTQDTIKAAASTTTSLKTIFQDYFSRTVFILLGLIAIAAAFYAFGKPDVASAPRRALKMI